MKKDLNTILTHTLLNKTTNCMEWTRCLNTDGYPRAVFDNNSNGKVHRVVYELKTNKDITGLVIRHTCDNPKCINPDHLIEGSATDNMMDRTKRERHGSAKLSHKEVKTIRALYSTKEYRQKELASMFNINDRTISSIIRFTHFKHVI